MRAFVDHEQACKRAVADALALAARGHGQIQAEGGFPLRAYDECLASLGRTTLPFVLEYTTLNLSRRRDTLRHGPTPRLLHLAPPPPPTIQSPPDPLRPAPPPTRPSHERLLRAGARYNF
jgi:hypothetical protein